jgi:hypothetical protein
MKAESRNQKAETEPLSPRLRHALACEVADLKRGDLVDVQELAALRHKFDQLNANRARRDMIRRLQARLGPNPFDTLAPH